MARRSHESKPRHSERGLHSLNSAVKPSSKADVADRNLAKGPLSDLDPGLGIQKKTFRENLPGLQVEAVAGSDGLLRLCAKNSRTAQVRPFVQHHGTTYVPASIPPGMGELV